MSIRNFARGLTAASIVALCTISASAGTFVDPSASVTGTAPSGIAWSAVATGTASRFERVLPARITVPRAPLCT